MAENNLNLDLGLDLGLDFNLDLDFDSGDLDYLEKTVLPEFEVAATPTTGGSFFEEGLLALLLNEGQVPADPMGDDKGNNDHLEDTGADEEEPEQLKEPENPTRPVDPCVNQREMKHYRFNVWQLQELEKSFLNNHYPTVPRRREIAEFIGVDERKIKIWFKNRRAREKRTQKALAHGIVLSGAQNNRSKKMKKRKSKRYTVRK